MNKRLYFLVIIFLYTDFSKKLVAEVEASSKQPIVINNVNSPVPMHVNITINNAVNVNTWITNKVQELVRNNNQKLMSLKEFCIAYGKEHKGFLLIGSLVSAYATLLCRLLYLEYVLNNSVHWSLWKREISNHQLHVYPQKELAKELLFAIQQRYHTTNTLADFFTPLVSFFNTIEQEIKLLNQFITFHKIVDRIGFKRLFPAQPELRKSVRKRLNRLTFLKQLLINWLAEYKVETNTANIVGQIK